MSVSRPQGRPRRGDAEVGRTKIISRLQAIVRMGDDVDLSRKTLAEQAGVTPALISYYFPNKEVLYEEMSRPIVHRYRKEMEKIIVGPFSNDAKLQKLVRLLVELYTKDSLVLDIYTNVMRKTGQSGNMMRCEVSQMTAMLADFFSSWRGHPTDDKFDATVLLGAVWGMCRFAARVDAQTRNADEDVTSRVGRVIQAILPGSSVAAC